MPANSCFLTNSYYFLLNFAGFLDFYLKIYLLLFLFFELDFSLFLNFHLGTTFFKSVIVL